VRPPHHGIPGITGGTHEGEKAWTVGAADRGYARQSACTAACTGQRCGVRV
jgi:hypothetical protein